MYALLEDGMEIKEGDEFNNPKKLGWTTSKLIGYQFQEYLDFKIRRKLDTLEDVAAFLREKKS